MADEYYKKLIDDAAPKDDQRASADDMVIEIATGRSAQAKKWTNRVMTFAAFKRRLQCPVRTRETMDEYALMEKVEQSRAKDVGGFVGGPSVDGGRTKESIATRTLITADLDDATWGFLAAPEAVIHFAAVLYSTHGHMPEAPRVRIVAPMSRTVTAAEYETVARAVARDIGEAMFDPCSYNPNQLMFWPSCPLDCEYYYREISGPALDVDALIARSAAALTAAATAAAAPEKPLTGNQRAAVMPQDPRTKDGVIGAFCRAYTVSEGIAAYLAGLYEFAGDDGPGRVRYTWTQGEGARGLIVYDDLLAYSHHGTDPANNGHSQNIFDLVCIHLYGGDTKAAVRELGTDPAVMRELDAERERDFQPEGSAETIQSGADTDAFFLCFSRAAAETVARCVPDANVLHCADGGIMLTAAATIHARHPAADIILAGSTGEAIAEAYREITSGKRDGKNRLVMKNGLPERPPIDALKLTPRGYPDGTDWDDVETQKGLEATKKELHARLDRERLLMKMQRAELEQAKANYMRATDLARAQFDDTKWAVDGLVPAGLTVLAAMAKKGKSWLALQMGLAVAAGETFLGRQTTKGAVLYAALEDTNARLQKRISLLSPFDPPADLIITTSFPRLDRGGLADLLDWIIDNRPALVILDVWNKVKPVSGEKGLNAYEADYKAVTPLKVLADETSTAILLVHHLKKGASQLPEMLEGLSGSMGLPSAADAILALKRDGQSDDATIARQGRDFESTEDIPIRWDTPAGWRLATKTELAQKELEQLSESERAVIDALRECGTLGPRAIAAAAEIKESTVRVSLKRLKEKGLVTKTPEGKYSLAAR